MKKSVLGWIVLGVAGLGVLLFLISFRIMRSQLTVNSEVGTSRQNPQTSRVAFSQLATQLVVEGDDPLTHAPSGANASGQ